jgi:hypothetical protein
VHQSESGQGSVSADQTTRRIAGPVWSNCCLPNAGHFRGALTSNLQVVVLVPAPNQASAAACNLALAAATTRYVGVIDSAANGDVPEAAQRVRVLEEHPEWAAICPMRSSVDGDAIQTFDLQALIARTPALCLSGAVIRCSELTAVGGSDEGLRTGYDFDLWLRLACG